MHYHRFDPEGMGFPRPRVPILPALGRQSLGRWRVPGPFVPLGADADTRHFVRGRYALTAACQQCGVGKQGALLAPAYHCRTMLDPAISLGAEVVLYGLKPDLSVDLASLHAALFKCKTPVKALLVAHYFGFAQALEALTEFCAAHEIALIEDCSHALFIRAEASLTPTRFAMGQTGRFAIASPSKFFPCEDGGLLWHSADAKPMPPVPQLKPTLVQTVKGFARSAQRSLGRNQVPDVRLLDDEMAAITARSDRLQRTERDVQEQDRRPSRHYLASDEPRQSLAWSRWIMRHTNVNRLAERRRLHYQQWADAVALLPHCQALFPRLTADCVPYMFALQIEHPETHFSTLKQLGLPVWRWDDLAMSDCRISSGYRLKLLQLPCHQELSEQQMQWMISALGLVMRQLPPGRPT